MAIEDLKSFGRKMRARARTFVGTIDKYVIAGSKEVHRTLVEATPVDTGRARVNWQIGIDEQPTNILYPQPQKPASPSAAMAVARLRAEEALAEYESGKIVHIANNVPYIGHLNNGWSEQAPAGFIEAGISAMHAVIEDADGKIIVETAE